MVKGANNKGQRIFPGLHDVVAKHGVDGSVNHALDLIDQRWLTGRQEPSLIDAFAGRSGRRIAGAVASSLTREIEGGADAGYSYSAWCLAGLPHRDQPIGAEWLIETDYASLQVRPGSRKRDDRSIEPLAVPSGALARLLLIDWQTEAYEGNNREIHLGKNPAVVLARLGLSRGGPSSRKLTDQIERLATCSITFQIGNDQGGVVLNERIVESFRYSGGVDPRTNRHARMIETVILSEAFYKELRRRPVLIDRAALKDIQCSPRAIDLYLWLAYRLRVLTDEITVSWTALWRQFGSEFKTLHSFRTEFPEPLALAMAAYKEARVGITQRGVILAPSPPPNPARARICR